MESENLDNNIDKTLAKEINKRRTCFPKFLLLQGLPLMGDPFMAQSL